MGLPKDKEEYIMEKNEGELQRLADQHYSLKGSMGTLTVAPVDLSRPNLRILDSGTADGLWLRDLQASTSVPHTYVGTDIVPAFFPEHDPPGLSFQVQSITQDWPENWLNTFDYVHQRLTLPGAGPVPVRQCVAKLAQLAKPGGWVELIEAYFDGPSTNGPAMQRFETTMKDILDTVGVGYAYATEMKPGLEDAGIEDIRERYFDIAYGAACPTDELASQSTAHLVATAAALRGFAQGRNRANLSEPEWINFPDEVKKEVESHGAHFKMLAVWGRTPM